jgi:hypothetical protein
MGNTFLPSPDYPYCFTVNLASVRTTDVPLAAVEQQLRTDAGLQRSLQAQGWTIIPDSERAEQIIEAFIREPRDRPRVSSKELDRRRVPVAVSSEPHSRHLSLKIDSPSEGFAQPRERFLFTKQIVEFLAAAIALVGAVVGFVAWLIH